MKVTTESGFTQEVEPKKLKDHYFQKLFQLRGTPERNALAYEKAIEVVLGGEEGEERLCKHLEEIHGFAGESEFWDELTEIMQLALKDEAKKSMP